MRMRCLVSILVLSILSSAAVALDFAPTRAGEVQGVLDAMEYDAAGNLYVIGTFAGTLDFNPAAGVEDNKPSVSSSQDIFITRFNANGSYAWTQTFGGSNTDDLGDLKLGTNVLYVCGYFSGPNVGIGGAESFATNGPRDGFILSLDLATGNANTAFGGDGVVVLTGFNEETVESMVLSSSGTLFITGSFNSSDTGIDAPGTLASLGQTDVLIAALNATTGAPVTSFGGNGIQTFVGGGADFPTDLALTGNTLYACGYFDSLNAGIGALGSINSQGQEDFYILGLDATTGNPLPTFSGDGIQTFGGTTSELGYSMALQGGVLYVVGDVFSTNAGFSTLGSFGVSTQFISDWCVIAIDAATGLPVTTFGQAPGGFQSFGGSDIDNNSDMAAIGGSIYLVGRYAGTDAGVGGSGSLDAQGFLQGAIVSLSASAGTAQSSFDSDGVFEPFQLTDSFAYHATNQGTNLAVGGRFTSGLTSYVQRFNATTGAVMTGPVGGGGGGGGGGAQPKPALTTFLATPNPAERNQSVAFTADVKLKGNNKSATLDFGDGTPPLTLSGDSLVDSLKNGISRSFTADGAYEAKLTVTSSEQTEIATLFVIVGRNTQVNPVTGMVSTSIVTPGTVGVSIDISRVPGAVNISTNFSESLGREIVTGAIPTRASIASGIVVADSIATDAGGTQKGRVRKTIAVSSRNAQESGPNDEPPTAVVNVKKFSGSFTFDGTKTDKVGFMGELTLPATFQPAVKGATAEGLRIHVGVGNVLDSVRVDAKGKPIGESEQGRLKKFKISFPKTADKPAKISGSIELMNASAAGFDTEGIQPTLRTTESNLTKKGVSRSVQLAIVIDGIAYDTLAPVLFKLATDTETGKIQTRKVIAK